MDRKSRDYEVCLCNHITRGEIEDLINETGITDLKKICEIFKIGNKCGGCREDIENIILDCCSAAQDA